VRKNIVGLLRLSAVIIVLYLLKREQLIYFLTSNYIRIASDTRVPKRGGDQSKSGLTIRKGRMRVSSVDVAAAKRLR